MPAWVAQKSPDKGLPGSSGPISTIGTTLPLTTSITMTPASRQDDAEMYRKLAERLMYQVEVLQQRLDNVKHETSQCHYIENTDSEFIETTTVYKKIVEDLESKIKNLIVTQGQLTNQLEWYVGEYGKSTDRIKELEIINQELKARISDKENDRQGENRNKNSGGKAKFV